MSRILFNTKKASLKLATEYKRKGVDKVARQHDCTTCYWLSRHGPAAALAGGECLATELSGRRFIAFGGPNHCAIYLSNSKARKMTGPQVREWVKERG